MQPVSYSVDTPLDCFVRLAVCHMRVIDPQGLRGFRIASLTLVDSNQVKHPSMACTMKGKPKSNGHD